MLGHVFFVDRRAEYLGCSPAIGRVFVSSCVSLLSSVGKSLGDLPQGGPLTMSEQAEQPHGIGKSALAVCMHHHHLYN